MDNAGSTSADVESWTLVNYLEEGGFPALLWDTLKDTLYLVANVKLSFQPRETLTIALILSPQSAFQKPCTTPIDEWWEKVYRHQIYRYRVKRNRVYGSSIEESPSHDSCSQEGKTQGQGKDTRVE
jgi:hypothetical protein